MSVQRWRIALTLIGIILAVIAVKLDDPVLTWITIGVLAVALLLRFALPRRPDNDESSVDS